MIPPVRGLEPGSVVRGLRVERELGRGAFGTVYLAEDVLLGRRVALKIVAAPGQEVRDRGLREARLVARVKSPWIVTLYRVHALEDKGWLLEMEFVAGGSLKDLLARDVRLPTPRAVEIASGILRGLQAAHEVGIVHGDIKPGNVLLEPSGAVKLADFGLSWLIDDATISGIGSAPVGTPAYMAPEVVLGQQNRTPSDLWSVGVILYEMIAGRPPFRTNRLQEFFHSVINGDAPPLPAGTPLRLQKLVSRLLAKDPSARPAAAEARDELARLGEAVPEEAALAAPAAVRPSPGPVLFGRDAEIEVLRESLAGLAGGEGAALLVTGEAGAGKSALHQWLLAEATGQGMLAVDVTVTRLEGALGPLLAGARRVAPPDLVVPGLPERVTNRLLHGESLADLGTRQQIAWMVALVFDAIRQRHPLVIAVGNAQDADLEDARLLADLLRQLPAKGMVVSVAFRTHDVDSSSVGTAAAVLHELTSVEGLRTLDLGPLPAEAIHRLLEQQTHATHIEPAVAQRLVGLAEGNPLLAIEMMRHLAEMGSVVTDGSAIRPTAGWDEASLPTRFHEVVERRLSGLSEEHRALLEAAAVDGRTFDGEALEAVLGRPLLDILRDLQRLYRDRELVEPRGDSFRFTSPMLQEVLYESIAPALRRAIHKRLAEHLEQRPQGADAARLGAHWEHAGMRDQAVPHLMKAAAEAAGRQEKLRLVDLCRRAGMEPGKLDPANARRYLDTFLRLAACLRELGRTEEMDRLFDDLLAAAQDDQSAWRIRVRRSMAHYYTRGVGSVDRVFLEKAAAMLPTGAESANAKLLLGLVAKVQGRLADAESAFRAADADARALGDDTLHGGAILQLAALAMRSARYAEAEDLYREAGRLSRQGGRPVNAAISDINRALAALEGGRIEGLDVEVDAAVRTLMMAGTGPVPGATIILAQILYAQGRLADAFARVETAVDLLRRYADVVSIEVVRTEEAHLAAVQGLLPRARNALVEAREAAEKGGHVQGRVLLACVEVQIECVAGDIEAARAAAARAVELAESSEEAATHHEPGLWIGEAVLYGLPSECLPDIEDPFVEAARAFAGDRRGPVPPGSLPGQRRATLRLVSQLWDAEMRHRSGDVTEAVTALRAVADGSLALGHVWLSLAALGRLHAWTDDPGVKEQHEQLLSSIAERAPEGDERNRLIAAWGLPAR
jgi:tetratricopeptide (TPR) repeat protein